MQLDGRYRWPLTLALGALAAIGAGTIVGQRVADEVNPFYANLAARDGDGTADPQIVDTSVTQSGAPMANIVDLSYGRGDDRADGQPADMQ